MRERGVDGVAHGRVLPGLFRRQVIEVLVHGLAWMNLVHDAIQTRHQHGGERQIRIAAGVREAYLDAARLRVWHVGDADRGRAVARRVGEHHRRFEARHQTLVAVGERVGEGVERAGVLDDAADVIQRRLAQPAVLIAGEQVLAVLRQRLVYVHAGTVVAYNVFGHEGRGLAGAVRHA